MEANMQILEGAQYRLRVKLTNEAGEQLPPELFRVYAGAFCPGYAPAHFHAERTAEEWVLTMPGLKPGRVPWNWQVIAAEYATGVEWLLAAGEVTVTPRHATGSGYVDPGELKITATLDKTTLQMTVQVGESTSACSLAVVDARNSAKAADASAKAAANSAEHADEQAQAAGKAAQTAGEKATEAGEHATAAGKAAQTAGEKADEAVLAAEEAKAAEAGSAAAADVVRYDFLPMTLEWLDSRFTKTLGEGKFSMTYTEEENTLRVAFALETTEAQIEESRALLDRVLPRKLVTEIDEMPIGFTRLAYIENPSNAFINLDHSLGWDYEIEAEYFVVRVPESTGFGVLIGHPEQPRQSVFSNVNYNTVRYDYNEETKSFYTGDLSECRFYVKIDKNLAVFNNLTTNKTYTITCTAGEFEQPANAYVFAGTGKGSYSAWIKLYSLIGSRGVPQFDLIPAFDEEVGAPCMFDKVRRKIFYNSGSGHFIAGVETPQQLDSVLSRLPDRTGQDGKELHLRLSDALYESAVASGIIEATATAKNWQIAYDPTTEIAA